MPPRPFLFPLNVGNDICHLARIRKLITVSPRKPDVTDGARLQRFLGRILTPHERALFWKRWHSPEHIDSQRLESVIAHLGGRFAAKEAIIKAVSWKRLSFSEIEVLPRDNGQGVYARYGPPDSLAEDAATAQLSISHDGDYATAVAMVCVEPSPSDVGGEAAAREP